MNKLILLVLLVSLSAFGDETNGTSQTATSSDSEKKFNPYESHWLTTFGFEGMNYDVPFEFDGAAKDILINDRELYGVRLGLGGELYLGAGFVATTKIEGYFIGTLFSTEQIIDNKAGSRRNIGQVAGADVTQSLGYKFSLKTKNPFLDEWAYLILETYVEAGIGRGWAYNKVDYSYDTGSAAGSGQIQEDYRSTVRDDLMNNRFGGGVNLTSRQGFFLYLKAFVNNFDITKRKRRTILRQDDSSFSTADSTDENIKMDPITTYAFGGGYKF